MTTTDRGEYVRNYYKVPAHKDGRIRYTGDPEGPRFGTIVGFDGQYVMARLDGDRHTSKLHPTWKVEYLQGTAGENAEEADETGECLICPVDDCAHREPVSLEDPDASLSDLVDHFANRHGIYDPNQQMGLLGQAAVTA